MKYKKLFTIFLIAGLFIFIAGAVFAPYWLYLEPYVEKEVTAGVFVLIAILFGFVWKWRDDVLFKRYLKLTLPPKSTQPHKSPLPYSPPVYDNGKFAGNLDDLTG